jgi:hypothetical protein
VVGLGVCGEVKFAVGADLHTTKPSITSKFIQQHPPYFKPSQFTFTAHSVCKTIYFMGKFNFISPTFFGMILFCFFLTFVDFKCSSTKLASISGVDMITGIELDPSDATKGFTELAKELGKSGENSLPTPSIPSDVQKHQMPPNPFAYLILALALTGIGVYFLRSERTKTVLSALAGVLGVLSCFVLVRTIKNELNSVELKEMAAMITIEAGLGLTLAGVFFFLAFFWNLVYYNLEVKLGDQAVAQIMKPHKLDLEDTIIDQPEVME